MTARALVLWDIDRTLLYVGDVDRQVYREIFQELAGRAAVTLPERGTGVPTPVVVHNLLTSNNVPDRDVAVLAAKALTLLPVRLAEHRDDLNRDGKIMPGAVEALKAVRARTDLVQTVVTGNLKPNAIIKLTAFGLNGYIEVDIGGYASDDGYRPNLVAIAQKRACQRYGIGFTRHNTVIIGDSVEDANTGRIGGCSVIGIVSGTTARWQLQDAGADIVFDDLTDTAAVMEAVTTLTSPRTGQP